MTDEPQDFASFEAFWPVYLSQHRKRATRFLHIAGTVMALLAILRAAASFNPFWLLSAPVFGYGVAWIAHAFVEGNHPATFSFPLYSLRGDLRMVRLWLSGQLKAELIKHGIAP